MQRFFLSVIMGTFLAFTQCNYFPHESVVPFHAGKVLDTLSGEKHPVRIEMDLAHRQVYWLNKLGEIYRIQADGTQIALINKGIGADLGITFIEDFCLDTDRDYIYFTDLFDLKSGSSAIKRSGLDGRHIETVAVFPQEVPLRVATQAHSEKIYFVSRSRQQAAEVYHIGTLSPETSEKNILHASSENITLAQLQEFSQGNELEAVTMEEQKIALDKASKD